MNHMNKNQCSDALRNVKCDVRNCVYHGDTGDCHASSIKVENPTAKSKSETFCSTYELK